MFSDKLCLWTCFLATLLHFPSSRTILPRSIQIVFPAPLWEFKMFTSHKISPPLPPLLPRLLLLFWSWLWQVNCRNLRSYSLAKLLFPIVLGFLSIFISEKWYEHWFLCCTIQWHLTYWLCYAVACHPLVALCSGMPLWCDTSPICCILQWCITNRLHYTVVCHLLITLYMDSRFNFLWLNNLSDPDSQSIVLG